MEKNINRKNSNSAETVDPITVEVIRNSFASIAKQMNQNLARSAYTPIIYEMKDCSVGIFDREINLVGQSSGLPVFLGTLGPAVKAVVDSYDNTEIKEGDVYIINDSYIVGSHLNDMTVLSPIFYKNKLIGYGATLGEGSLALAATIAAIAGISLVSQAGTEFCLPWLKNSCNLKSLHPVNYFVISSSALIQQLGLSESLSTTLIVVLVVSFAATTLDSATRIQRYIICEFGNAVKFKLFQNKYIATLISIIPAYLIATNDALRNELWQTFGASNQMLAALTLMILSIYFWKKGKNVIPLLIPMIIIMMITISALIIKFNQSTTILLKSINGILIVLIIWMITEGIIYCYKRHKSLNE